MKRIKNATSEEKFECSTCEKIFVSKASLKRHFLLLHEKKKDYVCMTCGKAFSLRQYLKEHEYIHTKEKPLICNVDGCKKRFRQTGKLSLHRRKHSNYKFKKYRSAQLNQNKRKKLNNDQKTLNADEKEEAKQLPQVNPSFETQNIGRSNNLESNLNFSTQIQLVNPVFPTYFTQMVESNTINPTFAYCNSTLFVNLCIFSI